MDAVVTAIVIAAVVVLAVLVYSFCRVAGKADREAEQLEMMRRFKETKKAKE